MSNELRPTLSEIMSRIQADAEARLDADELRRSDVQVLLRVLAGASHSIYGHLDWIKDQLFTDTCVAEYLERKASLFGLARIQAAKSSGTVQFSWESQVSIPAGTVLQNPSGWQYETTSDADSSGYATVRSMVGGSDYDLAVDETLSMVSPVTGVSGATVTTAIEGGTDGETDDELRERVLACTRNPPRQGTEEDFVAWAKEVAGVTRAWCYPKELGDGTVTVRFCTDGLTTNGIPTATKVAEVQEYIEAKCNCLCELYVEAPVAYSVDFDISITPDSTTTRAYAEEALSDLLKSEGEPGGTIYLSHVNAALSAVTGEEDHTVTTPAADIVMGTGYLPVLGTVTWAS